MHPIAIKLTPAETLEKIKKDSGGAANMVKEALGGMNRRARQAFLSQRRRGASLLTAFKAASATLPR